MNSKPNSEQGSSLLLVLVVTAIVSILAVALGTFVVSKLRTTSLKREEKQAYYVARSAAMSAMEWVQQQDLDYLLSEGRFPIDQERTTEWHNFGGNPNQRYRVSVEINRDRILNLTVTGEAEGVRKTVGLRAAPEGLYAGTDLNSAVIGLERISIRDDVTITGAPGSEDENSDQEIKSYALKFNRQVREEDFYISDVDREIIGSASVGPGTSQEIKNTIKTNLNNDDSEGAKVKEAEELAVYNLPEFPQPPEDLSQHNSLQITEDTTIRQPGIYPQIVVSEGAELTIELGAEDKDLVVDNLVLGNKQTSGEIRISHTDNSSAGRLNLYVRNRIEVNNNSTINQPRGNSQLTPADVYSNLIVYYLPPDPALRLEDKQQIVGNVYTRLANVELDGTNNLLGNLISGGEVVTVEGNSFNPNSQQFRRVIYAPNSRVELTTPSQTETQDDKKDLISGSVVGREVIVGPRFQLHLYRVNIGELPFDFSGGRKYTEFNWYE